MYEMSVQWEASPHTHTRHIISGILVTEDGRVANCKFQNYAYYLRQVQAKIIVHSWEDFN